MPAAPSTAVPDDGTCRTLLNLGRTAIGSLAMITSPGRRCMPRAINSYRRDASSFVGGHAERTNPSSELGRLVDECLDLGLGQERTVGHQGIPSTQPVQARFASGQRLAHPPNESPKRNTIRPGSGTVAGLASSSRKSADIAAGCGAERFRQPSRQHGRQLLPALEVPVSRTSRPSAKVHFPLPVRPTTTVRPGPGLDRQCRGRTHPAESSDRDE